MSAITRAKQLLRGDPHDLEPDPHETGARVAGPRPLGAGIAAVIAFGLVAMAVAFAGARAGEAWTEAAYWVALAIMFMPAAVVLIGGRASASERLWIVLALGAGLYLLKLLHSPDGFSFHDELGQQRAAADILRDGELFRDNPIVNAYSFFPGLAAASAALSDMSGLSVFASGSIIVGLGRVVLIVALFGLLARVTRSARIAGVGVLIYMANPNFLYFDAQFGYESLALALAAASLLAASWSTQLRGLDQIGAAALATICGLATVITHHLTSYALAAALVVWALLALWRRRRGWQGWPALAAAGAVVLAGTVAWNSVGGDAIGSQLGPIFTSTKDEVVGLISGGGDARAPFSAATGYEDPLATRIIGIAAVLALVAALPAALLALIRRRSWHPLVAPLALLAAIYPATLALRLTSAGTETSNRASEFVFVALGAGIAVAFGVWGLARRWDSGPSRGLTRVAMSGFVALVFAGGVLVGWAPTSRIPGEYIPGSDTRSVDVRGEAAADWSARWLPQDVSVLADGVNKGLIASRSALDLAGGGILGQPLGRLIVDPRYGRLQRRMLEAQKPSFLAIDERLSYALPRSGDYFDGAEGPGGYERPPSPQALAKYDDVEGAERVYDNGFVRFYDVRSLWEGSP